VRCCGIHDEKRATPRCHHKFVVFADAEGSGLRPVSVWTGSFNFTQNAVRSFENAVIISNPGIINAYIEEFEQVLALSEPLNWKHEYVDPEYRIGT
jgi:phosphatidylserine/phosphatidylglycerophosphate/cardiolipin synthase-like enzyme